MPIKLMPAWKRWKCKFTFHQLSFCQSFKHFLCRIHIYMNKAIHTELHVKFGPTCCCVNCLFNVLQSNCLRIILGVCSCYFQYQLLQLQHRRTSLTHRSNNWCMIYVRLDYSCSKNCMSCTICNIGIFSQGNDCIDVILAILNSDYTKLRILLLF